MASASYTSSGSAQRPHAITPPPVICPIYGTHPSASFRSAWQISEQSSFCGSILPFLYRPRMHYCKAILQPQERRLYETVGQCRDC